MTGGLPEMWFALAIIMWAMMYNATLRGADGFTSWQRRFSKNSQFEIYPFGALVLYQHPDDAPAPRAKRGSDKTIKRKWHNRLVQSILVGVATGPGGQ